MAFRSPRKIASSTTTPLGASGTFLGLWIDAINFNRAVATATSDQAGTLVVYQALNSDGTGGCHNIAIAVAAGAAASLSVDIAGRYVRLAYFNGVTPNTTLGAALALLP